MPSTENMITCTRRIQFCSGHRVYGHESKCKNLHGHNYVLLVTATAKNLDSLGRIIDYSSLKRIIGGWIDSNWDHRFLIYSDDPLAPQLAALDSEVVIVPFNPTAENMAKYLFDVISPTLFSETEIQITRIRLWETENCYADVQG